MKAYRDLFGNPLTKTDVATATRLIVRTNEPFAYAVQRQLKWGYGKATRILKVLADAKVYSLKTGDVILTNEEQAVNAALRQLKKGKK